MTILLVAVGALVGAAGPASAAELKEACGPWENATYFQTKWTYGRVSQRPCLMWYNNDNQVMARAEFRLDWPTECTVSPDCTIRAATKARELAFDDIFIGVEWNFNGQTGKQGRNVGHVNLPVTLENGEYIYVSTSQWMPHPVGNYSVSAQVGVDIDNDGGGWTYLPKTPELKMSFAPA